MNRREIVKKVITTFFAGFAFSSIAQPTEKKSINNNDIPLSDDNSLMVSFDDERKGFKIRNTSNKKIKGNGTPLTDLLYGNTRSFFLYLDDEKISGIKKGTKVDVTEELNRAMSDNISIFLPSGNYIIRSSIKVGIRSSLIGNGAKNVRIDNQGNEHAFIFPVGYDRGVKDFFGFSIESTTKTAKEKYAFYFNEDENGKLDYSASWRFLCIELNGQGMGGGWFLQDCFRVTIRDCGASALSNPFYIRGSVVQLTVDNFINNGDYQPRTSLGSYGVYMDIKKYAKPDNIKMPEGIIFINCRFVRQAVGARALGLYVQFINTEFDYSWQYGGYYAGGDKVDFINCYVGTQTSRGNDFHAFMVPSYAKNKPEPVLISNCTINMQKNKKDSFKSNGVSFIGANFPLCAAKIEKCFFRGEGYSYCIDVDGANGVVLRDNSFRTTGVNVQVRNTKTLTFQDNYGLGSYDLQANNNNPSWIVIGNVGNFEKFDFEPNNNSIITNY